MSYAICVFCSSSNRVGEDYAVQADILGRLLAQRGHTLIYGGTNIGLMGRLARAARTHGGRVVGILPQVIYDQGCANVQADELVVTRDLRERKTEMASRAEAFIALPGGFGTLEELLEVLALRLLELHPGPIVVVNTRGYYDLLAAMFEHLYAEGFARVECRSLYHFARDAADALNYIETIFPARLPKSQ